MSGLNNARIVESDFETPKTVDGLSYHVGHLAGIGNVVVAAATAADGTVQLGTDGSGKAEAKTVTGTGRVVAQPLTAGGADGDIITAAINCLNPFETAD